jgi:transcriptional antiterminator RfaH
MTAAAEKSWYAVLTHPRAEEKALGHLQNQGYRAYLPRYAKVVRHARRTSRSAQPLFPRYLFVSLDPQSDRWRPVRSTVGVIDIVRFGDRPTPLPYGVIDSLLALEDADGCIQLVHQPSLKQGSTVVVVDGPFARCMGLYEGITDSERVTILLDLLGRRVRVVLEADLIEAA